MKNVLIISHAMVVPMLRNRWKRLSELGENVSLIFPKKWYSNRFGVPVEYISTKKIAVSYSEHPVATTHKSNWGKYFIFDSVLLTQIRKADVIYVIHEETVWLHIQILFLKSLLNPQSKYIFFSMSAGKPRTDRVDLWILWKLLCQYADGMCCHYPEAAEMFRRSGFMKPILVQTQIGVDNHVFRKSQITQSKTVIGMSARLVKEKGIDEFIRLVNYIHSLHASFSIRLIGDGPERVTLEKAFRRLDLEYDFVGFVPQDQVAAHLQTIDILIKYSIDTEDWTDTFPLAIPQAQKCGAVVVSSNSPGVKYALGVDYLSVGTEQELHLVVSRLIFEPEFFDRAQRDSLKSADRFEINKLSQDLQSFYSDII